MISVILPVYNGSRNVSRSIESVLGQTWRDFELLIWDDGSSDDSPEIIRSFYDGRIRFFKNDRNHGLFPTLNSAIAEARGDLIRLWAQDDVMKPQCLEREHHYCSMHSGWGLAFCACDTIDALGHVIRRERDRLSAHLLSSDWIAQLMFFHGSITGNIANITIPAAVLRDIGPFCEKMIVSGDFDMLERISAKFPFLSIHEPLIYLRDHAGQFSRRSGSYPLHMIEDTDIYARLRDRVKLDGAYAKRYERCDRYAQYLHYAFRCFLAGDIDNARKAFRQVNRLDSSVRAGLWWLLTLNRHVYRVKHRYSTDLAAFLDRV